MPIEDCLNRGVHPKSLCPECNRKAVEAVIKGEATIADFRDRPGIIDAKILEEAGRILMRKACEKHGPLEDVLSSHPAFFRRMESLAFGRDFGCTDDCDVHNHGPNAIEWADCALCAGRRRPTTSGQVEARI